MNEKHKFRVDYSELYPGLDIPADVLAVLKKSDRKMRYAEQDLKRGRPIKDESGNIIAFLPGREDSYERLLEMEKQFEDDSADPEPILMESVKTGVLYRCLAMLSADELSLIAALFFQSMTVREYAAISGLSKSKIDRDKKKVLCKLKNLLWDFGF